MAASTSSRAWRAVSDAISTWVAALVLQHDLVLLTDDAHFANTPQMARA